MRSACWASLGFILSNCLFMEIDHQLACRMSGATWQVVPGRQYSLHWSSRLSIYITRRSGVLKVKLGDAFAAFRHVHFLDKSELVIGGVRFLGAPLK